MQTAETSDNHLVEFFDQDLLDPTDWSRTTVAALSALRERLEAERPAQPTTAWDDLTVNDLTVLRGDVQLSGELRLDGHLLVLGDLTADVVTGYPAHKILVVAGDLRCRVLDLCRSYLLVTGAVTASACVRVGCYGLSICAGGITTDLWLDEMYWNNHDLDDNPVDNIRTSHGFSSEDFPTDVEAGDALQAVVSNQVFLRHEEGGADVDHLVEQAKLGRQLLRPAHT